MQLIDLKRPATHWGAHNKYYVKYLAYSLQSTFAASFAFSVPKLNFEGQQHKQRFEDFPLN